MNGVRTHTEACKSSIGPQSMRMPVFGESQHRGKEEKFEIQFSEEKMNNGV